MSIRTDLAIECIDFAGETLPQGIITNEKNENGMTITAVEIKEEEAANRIGKPVGHYVTIETDGFEAAAPNFEAQVETVAEQLRPFLPEAGNSYLVVGLGNSQITPDALGPLAVRYMLTTRHISGELAKQIGLPELAPVSALAPGVLGQTGMESAEIITALCEQTKPDLVVAVDALAAGRLTRLGTTIQVSDTGISPGSGVLNKRKELSKATLGVPVLSIGVPTVVDLNTICQGAQEKGQAEKSMMVTPREIDTLIEHAAKTIAYALNRTFQPGLSLEEIAALTA
ncbi:GPR endopeptidase [Massiliimalia massiliensis]|uniref:GPR endopeptidase n=1 Tax=Massiliimalia massiliensis TaxID=1852384 RepID=UPI000984D17C|nr:GPR endopeptidase [Massiliimalia massiliensis]